MVSISDNQRGTLESLVNTLKKFNFPQPILDAFLKVDRRLFVPKEFRSEAYNNVALPIGYGQSISQPYTIAFMLTLLDIRDGQRILEIGSGSGYVLALLSELNPNGEIYGVEKIKELELESKKRLEGYDNVGVIHGDGVTQFEGERFDRILASAAFDFIPQKLIAHQLKMNGLCVLPVEDSIMAIKKDSGENKVWSYPGFSFVPIK